MGETQGKRERGEKADPRPHSAERPAEAADPTPREDLTAFERVNFQFDNVRERAADAGVPLRTAAFMVAIERVAAAMRLRGLVA